MKYLDERFRFMMAGMGIDVLGVATAGLIDQNAWEGN